MYQMFNYDFYVNIDDVFLDVTAFVKYVVKAFDTVWWHDVLI